MAENIASQNTAESTQPVSPDNASNGSDSGYASSRERGVSRRVVLLCLGLALIFGYIIPLIDVKFSNTFLGATHLPPGAVGVLLALLLVANPLLGLISKSARFSRNETLVVYISCLFSCLVPGHGSESGFVANLIGPFYYATRENGWLNFLGPHLKLWFTPALVDGGALTPGGNSVVQGWYTGAAVDGVFVPWGAWLVPLLAWGSLITASYVMLACLSVMLRAQWTQREALSFPLLQLPLEMTEDVDRPRALKFFRNPLMWTGFGIVVFIQLVRGLHIYFPDVPDVPFELDLGPYFTDVPWNQIGWTPLNIYPVAIGITYLLTSEISFSLWAFFWIIKFQYIAAYLGGAGPSVMPAMIGNTGHKIFTGMQITGAFFAYTGFALWTAREHLSHIVRRAFGKTPATTIERREALPYPMAFWGFVAALLFCVGWCVAAGIAPGIALWMWLAYLVIAIGLSRVVAEGGLLFVQQGWVPLGAWAHLFGAGPSTLLPASSLVPGSFVQAGLMTDLRGFLMPSFIQSFKLASDRGIAARPLLALIAAVITIGLVMGIVMNVRLGYQSGGLSLEWWFAKGAPQENANNIAALARGFSPAQAPSIGTWFWFGGGVFMTLALMLLRARFTWFPLHPIGYLLCLSYAMNRLWASIFVGWLCKILITRFAGTESYRHARPLFLGLALGDVVSMLFWLSVDAIQGRVGHQLMPS
jgi:hypothetical protein